jgi:CheY-like chemotaxis protein
MKKKLNCVLLIDDNDSDNFLHKKVLEKSGLVNHIEVAINGREAIDFLSNKGKYANLGNAYSAPELIFLDINMPVMDGWEFLVEYQKLEKFQQGKMVVIMLTTSLNPADKVKAETQIDSGCFQYKPLTNAMLMSIMQKWFAEYL